MEGHTLPGVPAADTVSNHHDWKALICCICYWAISVWGKKADDVDNGRARGKDSVGVGFGRLDCASAV